MTGRGRFAPETKIQLPKNAQLYMCFNDKNQKKYSNYSYPVIFEIFR